MTLDAAAELWTSLSLELRETAGGVVALIDALTPGCDEQDSELGSLRAAAARLVRLVEGLEATLLQPIHEAVEAQIPGGPVHKPPRYGPLADLLDRSAVGALCETAPVLPTRRAADGLLDLRTDLVPPEPSPTVPAGCGRWTVGDLIVDLGTQEVSVGDRLSWLPLPLIRVLAAMVRQPGRVFSREEIRGDLRGHRELSPSALHSAISRLRYVLRHELDADLEIQTVRGSGYRLVPRSPALGGADAIPRAAGQP